MSKAQYKAEDSVLSLLANNIDFHRTYGASMTPEYFGDAIRQDIFRVLRTSYQTNESKVTKTAFAKICKKFQWGEHSGLNHAKKVSLLFAKLKKFSADKDKGGYYFEQVRDYYRNRRTYRVLEAGFDALERGELEEAEHILQSFSAAATGKGHELADYVLHFQERLAQMKAPPEDKHKDRLYLGITPLDQALDFKKGNLLLFAGKTGGGKSIALQDVAVFNALQGKITVLVTNEMTLGETANRLDSRLTEISHSRFHRMEMSELEMRRWERMVKKIKKGKLWILELTDHCTVNNSFAILDEHKINPDLVIFDYANKMKPSNTSRSGWEDQGEVINDMAIAKIKRKVGIISAVQIVAEAFAKDELEIADLSFAKVPISMHVDFLIGIIQNQKLKLKERAKMQVMKTRHGVDKHMIEIIPDFDVVRIHSDIKRIELYQREAAKGP